MHPVSYHTSGYGANTLTHLSGKAAPCAVCEVPEVTDTLTVSGSTECPVMYVKEYHGWLMTSHYTHNRRDSVCVAVDAVASPNGYVSHPSRYMALYPMEFEGVNGHKHDSQVMCAVCSRCVDCPVWAPPEPEAEAEEVMDQSTPPQPGSSYVEYGKKQCSAEGAATLYAGFVATGYYVHEGSTPDSLCVAADQFVKRERSLSNRTTNNDAARLYPVKSQIDGYGAGFARDIHSHVIPCAACFVPDRSAYVNVGSAKVGFLHSRRTRALIRPFRLSPPTNARPYTHRTLTSVKLTLPTRRRVCRCHAVIGWRDDNQPKY